MDYVFTDSRLYAPFRGRNGAVPGPSGAGSEAIGEKIMNMFNHIGKQEQEINEHVVYREIIWKLMNILKIIGK